MKKVLSLLLVVAMLVSLSVVASAAPANAAGGMHTVITETDSDITVEVIVTNATNFSGLTSYIFTDAVSYVAGSSVKGDEVSAFTFADNTKTDGIKLVLATTDAANYFDGTFTALTYKVVKVDPTKELSVDDFKYAHEMGFSANKAKMNASKITTASGGTVAGVDAGANFTTSTQPAYFTIEYVDARTPVVEEPTFKVTAAGTTITCAGKVDATVENYGVEFTADSTVKGARAQKYYGAMPGDTVKEYTNNGSTTFTFGEWDGTFEIVLEGVHAGEKTVSFFANDTTIAEANAFTVTVE